MEGLQEVESQPSQGQATKTRHESAALGWSGGVHRKLMAAKLYRGRSLT